MDGEFKRFIKVWFTVLSSLLYCHFIASKIPKGKLRLFSLLPIISLFILLPLSLSSILLTGITSFFITWLGIFKLILFSFNMGPLSSDSDPPLSLLQFLSISCFPIRIKQNKKYPDLQSPKLPLNLPLKILISAILITFQNSFKNIDPNVSLCIYCAMIYLFIDVLLGISNELVRLTLGIELEPPSNEPYLATSLQDFWGKRWNLLVSNTLRYSIYKPVRSAVGNFMSRRSAVSTAVFATFVVSGLMHELLFFYITRTDPTWEVTCFFVLHGFCVLVEFGFKTVVGKNKWRLHWAVSGPLTVVFVVVTANWLFFPPLLRTDAVAGALGEFPVAVEYMKDGFGLVFERARFFMV